MSRRTFTVVLAAVLAVGTAAVVRAQSADPHGHGGQQTQAPAQPPAQAAPSPAPQAQHGAGMMMSPQQMQDAHRQMMQGGATMPMGPGGPGPMRTGPAPGR